MSSYFRTEEICLGLSKRVVTDVLVTELSKRYFRGFIYTYHTLLPVWVLKGKYKIPRDSVGYTFVRDEIASLIRDTYKLYPLNDFTAQFLAWHQLTQEGRLITLKHLVNFYNLREKHESKNM